MDIANRYLLTSPGVEPRWGQEVFYSPCPSRLSLGPTEHPVRWLARKFSRKKATETGQGANHPSLFSAQVKNENYTPYSLLCLHGMLLGDLYLHNVVPQTTQTSGAITCYCYSALSLTSLHQTREKRNWNLFIPRSFIYIFVFVRTIVSGAKCRAAVITNGVCYMSLACDSLLRHWVAMLRCLPGTCRRRVQLKFCTSNLRIRAEQVMLVHEETYLLLWARTRTHTQAHSLTNCSCKPKDGNSTFFFFLLLTQSKRRYAYWFVQSIHRNCYSYLPQHLRLRAALRLIIQSPIFILRLKFHFRSIFRENLKKRFIYCYRSV